MSRITCDAPDAKRTQWITKKNTEAVPIMMRAFGIDDDGFAAIMRSSHILNVTESTEMGSWYLSGRNGTDPDPAVARLIDPCRSISRRDWGPFIRRDWPYLVVRARTVKGPVGGGLRSFGTSGITCITMKSGRPHIGS